MVTLSCILNDATKYLEQAGLDSARLDATLLLSHILDVRREKLIFHGNDIVQEQYVDRFLASVERRAQREPVAYITGQKEFWSLDFFVTRDTLIPRPDSETLVEAVLRRIKSRAGNTTILDLGTGSGCLLVALLKELPRATGVGVDSNERALLVAQRNAEIHGVSERAVFKHSHWCDAVTGTFDLIISNPPYIAETDRKSLMRDVVDYEPAGALFAGQDGLDDYRTLAPLMPRFLKKDGMLVWEVGQLQAQQVMEMLHAEGLTIEAPEFDLAGIARCVVARNDINNNKE